MKNRQKLREEVFADKAKYYHPDKKKIQCHYCKRFVFFDEYTIDHKMPRSKGGADSKDNLVPCCERCNFKKKNLEFHKFSVDFLEQNFQFCFNVKEIEQILHLVDENSEVYSNLFSTKSNKLNDYLKESLFKKEEEQEIVEATPDNKYFNSTIALISFLWLIEVIIWILMK